MSVRRDSVASTRRAATRAKVHQVQQLTELTTLTNVQSDTPLTRTFPDSAKVRPFSFTVVCHLILSERFFLFLLQNLTFNGP